MSQNEPAPLALRTPHAYPANAHPAGVYLARLQGKGRATMASALTQIAFLLSDGTRDVESLPWHALRYGDTQRLWSRLHEPGANGNRLKPATIRKYVSALRGVLHSARRLGHMTAEDYFAAIDLPRVRGETLPAGRSLARDEVAGLLASCAKDTSAEGVRDLALLHVITYTGLRLAEIVNLTAEGGDVVRILGKGNVERAGFLPRDSLAAVRAWTALRGSSPGPLFRRIVDGKVLPDRLTESIVRSLLAARGRAAGLARFTPHDLRRTFATRALDEGADLAKVSRLMGHRNIRTTAGYDRRDERTGREVVERLAKAYGAAEAHADGPHLSVLELFGVARVPQITSHDGVHRSWGAYRLQAAVDRGFIQYTPVPLAEEKFPLEFFKPFSGGADHRGLCALGARWIEAQGLLWSARRNHCGYPDGGVADVMSTDRHVAVECGVTEPVKITLACERGLSVLFIPFYWYRGLDRPFGFLFSRTKLVADSWWKAAVALCMRSRESYRAVCAMKRADLSPEDMARLLSIAVAAPDGMIGAALGHVDIPVEDVETHRKVSKLLGLLLPGPDEGA